MMGILGMEILMNILDLLYRAACNLFVLGLFAFIGALMGYAV